MGFPRLGAPEVILILAIVLLVFGVGKLPQVGEALGKGIRAFRKGQSMDDTEAEKEKPQAQKTTQRKATKS